MHRPAPTSATVSGLLLGMVAVMLVLAALRLRAARTADRPLARWRRACLIAAPLLTAAVCLSPMGTLGAHYLFTAHVVQVTILMGFVPPLLLLGMAGWRPRAASRLTGSPLRLIVHPVPAIILVNVTFFSWHATRIFEACLEHEELYALQLLTLVLASTAFWWPIVEPGGRTVMSPFIKLGYILLAAVPQTFAGLLFALAHEPLYAGYAGLWGVSPLSDQQVAGAMMALFNKIALFAAFSVVFWRMLREEDDAGGERGDDWHGGRDDRPAPAPQPPAPAWLHYLERGPVVDEPASARPGPPRREVPAR